MTITVTGRDLDSLAIYPVSGALVHEQDGTTRPLDFSNYQGHDYQVQVPPSLLKDFQAGPLRITVSQGMRVADPIHVTLTDVSYNSFPTTVGMSQFPTVAGLGFVGNTVVSLRRGLDPSLRPTAVVRRYSWATPQLAAADTAGDYFEKAQFSPGTLAATSPKFVYLLNDLNGTAMSFQRCPVQPPTLGACTTWSPTLPAGAKAFAVSADDALGVVADKTGALSWMTLTPGVMLAPQVLIAASKPPTVDAASLGIGDLNNDGTADLVVAWQAGGKTSWDVFIGQKGGGFTEGTDVADQLNNAAATVASVDAMTVADMDLDGLADVVVAQGWSLHLLKNRGQGFVEGWKTTVSGAVGSKLTAVAAGQLDGTTTGKGQLDLVAGSDGLADPGGMAMGTVYLISLRSP